MAAVLVVLPSRRARRLLEFTNTFMGRVSLPVQKSEGMTPPSRIA
jgi:hypothetical protein